MDHSKLTKQEILEGIKKKVFSFNRLPIKYKEDEDIVVEAIVGSNYDLLEKWKTNKSVAVKVCKKNCHFFKFFDKSVRNDKQVVLEIIKDCGINLSKVSKVFQNSKEIVLLAVKENGYALRYASERLKDNKDVALEAVKQNGWSFLDISERLKKDKDISLEAVRKEGRLFFNIDFIYHNEKCFLEALENSNIKDWCRGDLLLLEEKMEILANLREREIIKSQVNNSEIKFKKVKF